MLGSGKIHIQSVSEITSLIKKRLEGEFRFVHIRGEVSNLRCPFSGHLYFSLKDDSAQIKAVLFKGQQKYLEKDIEDGQEIICHGRVSVYEPRGEYQLVVDTVDHYGFGELQKKFEGLKRRLAEEGLFDPGLKKPLPPYPQSLVVITSPTGAALYDFLKIAHLRQTMTRIVVLPVRVQGTGAAEEIAAAISRADREIETDIIVLCRGGGSIEDLWAFNEENVARAIHHSKTPIVTGVGHEIDTTIADFCADFRASTPTGAAERLLQDSERLHILVEELERKIISCISTAQEVKQNRVNHCRRFLGDLDPVFDNLALKLDLQTSHLVQAMNSVLEKNSNSLKTVSFRLRNQLPSAKLTFQEQRLFFVLERLRHLIRRKLEQKRAEFVKQTALLESVSPLSILARGYSIVTKIGPEADEKEIVKSSVQVSLGQKIDIRLHRGSLECEVTCKK